MKTYQTVEESPYNIVIKHLISLSLYDRHEAMRHYLNEWYNGEFGNLKDWKATLPDHLHPLTDKYFLKHTNWCEQNNIFSTPTIFLNGKQIPKEYSLEDFDYLLRLMLSKN